MSIPTSLIVVLLVVAWLVVLVPMVAKRRDKVPRAQSGGNGFRVLRQAQATLKRRPKRVSGTEKSATAGDEAETTAPVPVTQTASTGRERTLVSVGAADPGQPADAAEEWAAAHAGYRPASRPEADPAGEFDQGEPVWDAEAESTRTAPLQTAPLQTAPMPGDSIQGAPVQTALWADAPEPAESQPESVTAFPPPPDLQAGPRIPAEVDEQEWSEHAAASSAPLHRTEVDDEALRPTPRRRGRGGYDPEAAEATRAYKYRQRRRVSLVLAAATVVFTLTAILLASWLWIGAVVSLGLLVLYLAYLRRQVKIEAQIRQRRMERLQRARQIRPEYGRGRPPARAGRSAAGPGRTVVDLDDDDPTFDHLEAYDPPVMYRRASGQ